MKLSKTAQEYYRLTSNGRIGEESKSLNNDINRILAGPRSGARNRDAADILIRRWQSLVDIRIDVLLEAYELDGALFDDGDIEEFFETLKSGSESMAKGWSTQYPRNFSVGYLLARIDPINVGARSKLYAILRKKELQRSNGGEVEMHQNQFTKQNSFESYLMRKGVEVQLEDARGSVINTKAIWIDKETFVFPKNISIEVGTQFQMKDGDDWWEVTDKQDEMSRFEGKVGHLITAERVGPDRKRIRRDSEASAVIHTLIGGVQIGGSHNTQIVSVNHRFDQNIIELRQLIEKSSELTGYQKEDAIDALAKLPALTKQEGSDAATKRAKEKLEIVRSVISIGKDLAIVAMPYLEAIARHWS